MNTGIEPDNANIGDGISQRAVSLYGQTDAMDDFPVLKAFQQYVDAEQEKSRKRIMLLGIVFSIILVGVVAIFLFLLQNINLRNQALSDRLVEYAMKESERREQQPKTQPQNDAMIKMMGETLKALQAQVEESAKRAANSIKEPKVDPESERKVLQARERLQREKANLEAEKKLVAAEKERLHQIEIDRQRRKLYPELYGETQEASPSSKSTSPSRQPKLSDQDIMDILKEVEKIRANKEADDEPEDKEPVHGRAAKDKKSNATGNGEGSSVSEDRIDDEMEAIEYFKDDEFKMPVDYKGNTLKMSLPVE